MVQRGRHLYGPGYASVRAEAGLHGSGGSRRATGRRAQASGLRPCCARDFALLCSARYQEFIGQAGPVQVRVVALPEHAYYAQEMVRVVCEAIPVYSQWFGPLPYPQFTIAESYFGWNGNECGGLVMIDERVFAMPHFAGGFVEYLLTHEVCHQWWYNTVGTNGYCETWMDKALAVYFSHLLMDKKHGRNEPLLRFPKALAWVPNIHRETYRYYSMYGAMGAARRRRRSRPCPSTATSSTCSACVMTGAARSSA